jgi:hypothetical protein
MSLTRHKLTKAEIVEHAAQARQMQTLGIEIGISQEWLRVAEESARLNAGVEIEQVGGLHESTIFELESGRWGCVIPVKITNQAPKPIYYGDVQLRMPWEDDLFDWLTPIQVPVRSREKRGGRGYQAYRFPGRLGLEFPYKEVANHILLEGRCLSPKRPVTGLLLAIGGLMPDHLQHGQWLDVTLAIIGTDHREYSQQIQLWTERLESRPKPVTRRSGLRDDSGYSGVMPMPSDLGSNVNSGARRILAYNTQNVGATKA